MEFLAMILVSATCIYGDILIKNATLADPFNYLPVLLASLIYASSAIGWLYVFRHMEVKSVGVMYPLMQMLMLTALGVLKYKEVLTTKCIIGLVLGVISVILVG
jgi:hypothetical protein